MEAFHAANDAKLRRNLEKAGKLSPEERKRRYQQNIAKAREAVRLKKAQREIVRRKVEQGLPITEEERKLLNWRSGGRTNAPEEQGRLALAAAAKVMLKPKSVNELRLLVETTAAKSHYNPIEALIELTRKEEVKDSEKIAIHKALLPFLVPQMATPKPEKDVAEHGVKVTVTQFVFPSNSPTGPLHQEKPAMVEVSSEEAPHA